MVVKLRRRKVSYYRYSAVIQCRFLQLYILLVNVILLDDKENASPAASHALDGLTDSRDGTGQSVGMYDYEHRDDHEVDNNYENNDLHLLYCTLDNTEIGIKSEVSPNITQHTINPLHTIDTSVINTINNGGGNIESNVTSLITLNQYITLLKTRKIFFSFVTAFLMIFVPYIGEAIFKPNDDLKVRTSIITTIHKALSLLFIDNLARLHSVER